MAEWTREIIVVLNHDANDGTEEVARQFGAKVYREPWKGYLAQKNSAAEKCTQDWIINLDADESVSDELREELKNFFPNRRIESDSRLSVFPDSHGIAVVGFTMAIGILIDKVYLAQRKSPLGWD